MYKEMTKKFSEGKREWSFDEMVELTMRHMQVSKSEAEQIVINSKQDEAKY